ncbi:MAG: glycosyltransferase family 52 protein, partial [Clostridium sp.]|nr:glycosyltransferase family 52 protein [Clostridium sp.]
MKGIKKSKKRVYICHTYYHAYIACLKELELIRNHGERERGQACLLLSSLSNDFGSLKERAEKSELFAEVLSYDEKPESFFPELLPYHKDRGNIALNMLARIKFTKMMGRLQAPFVPVDLREYEDIYVFCDSDPIGYYLSTHKIYYHAVEDGLDCIRYYDAARYDNRGCFGLKAWMAARNLIFIQNGYSKYCLDMEVNDISSLAYPCKKYIEKPRRELTENLKGGEKATLVSIFVEDLQELKNKLAFGEGHERKVLLLTEPLCNLETRERIFRDIIDEYGYIEGQKAQILIKPHPRDVLDYRKAFSEQIVLDGKFPMEILNYMENLVFDRVITVFTVPDAISFAKEKLILGEGFMDTYEAPE